MRLAATDGIGGSGSTVATTITMLRAAAVLFGSWNFSRKPTAADGSRHGEPTIGIETDGAIDS